MRTSRACWAALDGFHRKTCFDGEGQAILFNLLEKGLDITLAAAF